MEEIFSRTRRSALKLPLRNETGRTAMAETASKLARNSQSSVSTYLRQSPPRFGSNPNRHTDSRDPASCWAQKLARSQFPLSILFPNSLQQETITYTLGVLPCGRF